MEMILHRVARETQQTCILLIFLTICATSAGASLHYIISEIFPDIANNAPGKVGMYTVHRLDILEEHK